LQSSASKAPLGSVWETIKEEDRKRRLMDDDNGKPFKKGFAVEKMKKKIFKRNYSRFFLFPRGVEWLFMKVEVS
jgi:hypothetical protein